MKIDFKMLEQTWTRTVTCHQRLESWLVPLWFINFCLTVGTFESFLYKVLHMMSWIDSYAMLNLCSKHTCVPASCDSCISKPLLLSRTLPSFTAKHSMFLWLMYLLFYKVDFVINPAGFSVCCFETGSVLPTPLTNSREMKRVR